MIEEHVPASGTNRAVALVWLVVFLGSLAVLVLGTLGRATNKALWHDEIFTLYIARQPAIADIWRSLEAGVDLNPPLYHVAVHGAVALLGPTALATRLPALLGFVVASASLYAFARRHAEPPVALFAALVPSLTGAYMYAYEGRPYGLVLGFAALALLCWQRRDGGSRRWAAPTLCGVAVAAAAYTHYYGILLLVPLACGELARVVIRRRIDWPMWVALGGAAASVIGVLPLVSGARRFAATFWSRPSASDLIGFYDLLLEPLSLVLLAAASILTVLTHGAPRTGRESSWLPQTAGGWNLPVDEMIAALALLAIPAIGYLLGVLVTGAFHERYVLYAVLGFAVLASAWVRALPLSRLQATGFIVVCLFAFAARQGTGVLAWIRGPQDPLVQHRALLEQASPDRPLVVSHALVFLPVAHYSTPSVGRRLTYLVRPPAVVQRLGVDTGARALQRLSGLAPLDVQEYDRFVQENRQFCVYGPASWLVPQLLRDGATLQLIAQSGDMSLFRVEITNASWPS